MRLLSRVLFSVIVLSNIYAYAESLNDNNFYIATDYGRHFGHKFKGSPYYKNQRTKGDVCGFGFGYLTNNNLRFDLNYKRFNEFKYNLTTIEFDDEVETYIRINYNQKISSNLYMGNIYYQISNNIKLKPYITVGLGISQNKSSSFNLKTDYSNDQILFEDHADVLPSTSKLKTKYNFAYSIGGGLSYELNDKVTLDLINYRYYDLGKAVTVNTFLDGDGSNATKTRLRVHTITTGFRISF